MNKFVYSLASKIQDPHIAAHIVSALNQLREVVDEMLDDALLVGHHRLVQRSVAIVISSLEESGTI